MPPRIKFSKHALDQMQERKISKNEVIFTLSNPDKIITQPQGTLRAVKLTIRGQKKYLLTVIYRHTNFGKKVITTYLTSKIKKYL